MKSQRDKSSSERLDHLIIIKIQMPFFIKNAMVSEDVQQQQCCSTTGSKGAAIV
jgi:hypothetical protein